ncbi:hypothetical protein APSETT444_000851 [Aspergillus pseudonomiae]
MEPTVNPTAVDRTASTTTANTAAIQGQACDVPRNDSSAAEESPLSDVTNSIASVAGNSISEAKNKLATVASDESVQSVWEQVRSMAPGRNDETQVDTSPSQDEIDLIDNMDNEKIAEFLREKNRSDARLPKRR